jgi:hypothetical protein
MSKTTTCKTSREHITKAAGFYSKWGVKAYYKRLFIICMVAYFAIGTLGCANVKKTIANLTTVTKQEPTLYNIGETVLLKDFKVTVNGVRTIAAGTSDNIKPKEGNEFFLVDCTIENVSSENKDVSAINIFKVVDTDDVSYDKTLFTDNNGSLKGTIEPTKTIKGEYWLEVPTGKTILELEFEPSLTNNIQETVVFDSAAYEENKKQSTGSKELVLNKPFIVKTENGNYSITIEGARLSNKRTQVFDKNIYKVAFLDYSYTNQNFGDKIGKELYIDAKAFQVTDDEGKVLNTYAVDDENRVTKKVPIGGNCKGAIAYAITTNSKNINVKFTSGSGKTASIKVPIK